MASSKDRDRRVDRDKTETRDRRERDKTETRDRRDRDDAADSVTIRKSALFAIAALVGAALLALILFFVFHNSGDLSQVEGPKIARVGADVVGEMVEGYPSAVPKWEGATVVSSDHTMRTDFDVYDLTLTTSDPFETVLHGYLTALQKEGFQTESPRDIGDIMTTVTASTTAHAVTYVFRTDESGLTEITASIRTFR